VSPSPNVESNKNVILDQLSPNSIPAPILSDAVTTLSNYISAAIASQQDSMSTTFLAEIIESSLFNI